MYLAWSAVRVLGISFWLTDVGLVHPGMEKLARAQYLFEGSYKLCPAIHFFTAQECYNESF